MQDKVIIEMIPEPNPIDKQKMMQVRFDAIVRMFDSGQREIKSAVPMGHIAETKSLPPQWFKMEMRLSLETLKYADPYTIGREIQAGFMKLQAQIDEYERR